MKSVLFYDPCAPKPYHFGQLSTEALGGTESTVCRIAEALAQTGCIVRVEQHNRADSVHYDAEYIPEGYVTHADRVVCLRSIAHLPKLRARFPKSELFLWSHDLVSPTVATQLQTIRDTKATILAVSEFHRTQWHEVERLEGGTPIPVKRIYNPIDQDLVPDGTPVDPNKLVFFSSPHKGLRYALEAFQAIRRLDPDFRLYVANPGYLPDLASVSDGVINLGALPQPEVHKHVRSALCVFYPNYVFPETFGLVFAEADAVGTPVITAPIGAAREVLYHPAETLDVRNLRDLVDRVLAWKTGSRPAVKGRDEFRLNIIRNRWGRILNIED